MTADSIEDTGMPVTGPLPAEKGSTLPALLDCPFPTARVQYGSYKCLTFRGHGAGLSEGKTAKQSGMVNLDMSEKEANDPSTGSLIRKSASAPVQLPAQRHWPIDSQSRPRCISRWDQYWIQSTQ